MQESLPNITILYARIVAKHHNIVCKNRCQTPQYCIQESLPNTTILQRSDVQLSERQTPFSIMGPYWEPPKTHRTSHHYIMVSRVLWGAVKWAPVIPRDVSLALTYAHYPKFSTMIVTYKNIRSDILNSTTAVGIGTHFYREYVFDVWDDFYPIIFVNNFYPIFKLTFERFFFN